MKIIDTHIHIWDFGKAEYLWLENDTSLLKQNYHLEDLEAERLKVGVEGGVLVQAANNFEDTDWMLEVAGRNDWIKGVVGWLPLMDPEATTSALENKYLANPYFKGVRHLIHDEADPKWLLQPSVLESLSILASHGLVYDVVGILTGHIDTALQVAEKVPELKMVFDHLNQPPIKDGLRFGEWGVKMKEAAKYPQFHVKISGMGTTSGKPFQWGEQDISPYLEFALENFGVERCFCGGDWPVSLLAGSYSYSWNNYLKAVSSILEEKEQSKVLSENAVRFYGL